MRPSKKDPQRWARRERNRRQRVGVDPGADGEEPADAGLVDRREHRVDEVDGVALDLVGRGPVTPPQHRHRELPRHAARASDGADVAVDDHGRARLVVAHGDEDRFEWGVGAGDRAVGQRHRTGAVGCTGTRVADHDDAVEVIGELPDVTG